MARHDGYNRVMKRRECEVKERKDRKERRNENSGGQ